MSSNQTLNVIKLTLGFKQKSGPSIVKYWYVARKTNSHPENEPCYLKA